MNTRDALIDTMYDNRYRIQRRVGSGGMANVYLAEDGTLGRRVAIKVLNQRYAEDDQFVERFLREASAAARLNHPNIVQVYDRGEAGGTYYIAMEYVDGMTLKELITKRGSLTEGEVAAYGRQALQALRFAHRNGVVHRDVKPHNMMIDTEGRLKIADFGIARAGADAGLTEVGSIVGTAQYLSPEQARGEQVSAASDLYSLGVVLFEMCTGRVPFDGDSPVNVALKHVNDPVPSPRSINPEVSRGLEGVILRAMQKEPAARYQTADELLEALDVVRGGGVPEDTTSLTQVVSRSDADAQRTTIAASPLRPPAGAATAGAAYAASRYDVHEDDALREDEEVAGRGAWPWLLLLGIIVLLALAALFALDGGDGGEAATVTVPKVTGLRQDAAEQKLRAEGLEVGEVEQRFDAEVGSGIVIEQRPGASQPVEEGSSVDLVVSRGREPVKVPDVVGQPEAAAVREIRQAGLPRPAVEREFSEEEPGTVLEQDPAGGDEVAPDTKVTLVVSRGEERVTVPAVVGLSEQEARAQLEQAGFQVTTAPADSTSPKGEVLGQRPGANAKAEKGTTVTLQVASGKNVVPEVLNLSPEEAEAELQAAGFDANVTEQVDETLTPGDTPRVTDQQPAAKTRLDLGSTVELVVSTPPPGE